MNITSHTLEKLHDPTGILSGDRYEYLLAIEVPEDDELYSENGLHLRVIYAVDENGGRIVQYHFVDESTNQSIDFALEEDEEALVSEYCAKQIL